MARSRNIKPGFFHNDELAEIEPLGRLLFAGLWTIADRKGRLKDRPKWIKAEVLPYDNCNVDKLLYELHQKGFIIRYEADGEKYIEIPTFNDHQNPHKNERPSKIPAPPEYSTSTVQVSNEHTANPADSFKLIPDSLNMIPYNDVVTYLNEKAKTQYRTDSRKTKDLIRARWNEGFRLDDFKTVIDKKCATWSSDQRMAKYLRPETLFGTKFESYLNEKIPTQPGSRGSPAPDKYDNFYL